MSTVVDSPAVQAQRAEALQLANERRTATARALRELKALPSVEARAHVAGLLRNREPWIASVPVDRLLLSTRGVGRSKTALILRYAGITSGRIRAAGLTDRQREALAAAVCEPGVTGRHTFETPKPSVLERLEAECASEKQRRKAADNRRKADLEKLQQAQSELVALRRRLDATEGFAHAARMPEGERVRRLRWIAALGVQPVVLAHIAHLAWDARYTPLEIDRLIRGDDEDES